MNPNYIHTITVYNRIRPQDNPTKRDIWYRKVLRNCFWQCKTKDQQEGTTIKPVNTFVVRIPQNMAYLPYRDWIRSPEGRFTLNKGDIIVHGECKETISSSLPVTELLKRYGDDAFAITATADNTSSSFEKHYRAGG